MLVGIGLVLSINIHNLKKGIPPKLNSKTIDRKDDISLLSHSFNSMSKTISEQKNKLILKNKEILDNKFKLINSEKNKALADLGMRFIS